MTLTRRAKRKNWLLLAFFISFFFEPTTDFVRNAHLNFYFMGKLPIERQSFFWRPMATGEGHRLLDTFSSTLKKRFWIFRILLVAHRKKKIIDTIFCLHCRRSSLMWSPSVALPTERKSRNILPYTVSALGGSLFHLVPPPYLPWMCSASTYSEKTHMLVFHTKWSTSYKFKAAPESKTQKNLTKR